MGRWTGQQWVSNSITMALPFVMGDKSWNRLPVAWSSWIQVHKEWTSSLIGWLDGLRLAALPGNIWLFFQDGQWSTGWLLLSTVDLFLNFTLIPKPVDHWIYRWAIREPQVWGFENAISLLANIGSAFLIFWGALWDTKRFGAVSPGLRKTPGCVQKMFLGFWICAKSNLCVSRLWISKSKKNSEGEYHGLVWSGLSEQS